MTSPAHHVWYFEVHLATGEKLTVNSAGAPISGTDVLPASYIGTEAQAHEEADRRCDNYDRTHEYPARAISFSPASTLIA